MIPYLDMWVGPEVGNDWSVSAATPIQKKFNHFGNAQLQSSFPFWQQVFFLIFLFATIFGGP